MTSSRRSDWTFLVVATFVALFVRWIGLGADDFWSDEIHTAEAVALPATDLVRERLAAGHQPLYFLLLKGWSALFGDGHMALRLPSALFGAACAIPAYRLFRRLLEPRAAMFATDVLVLHPLWVELGREARMYSLLALIFLVALEALGAAREDGRVRVRFWVAVVIGPLVHATWGLGLVALGAWVWFARGDDEDAAASGARRRTLWACAASAAVLLAATLAATTAGLPLTRRPWHEEAIVYVLRQFSGAGISRELVWVYGAVAVAWGLALVVGWRALARQGRALAASLLVAVHGGAVVAALTLGVAWGPVRYVSLAVIAYALLAGAACGSRGWLRLVVIGAVVTVLVIHLGSPRTTWSDEARDVRAGDVAVEDALARCPGEGERIVLRYYLNHPR